VNGKFLFKPQKRNVVKKKNRKKIPLLRLEVKPSEGHFIPAKNAKSGQKEF